MLKDFIVKSEKYNFPIHRPYYDLTQKEKDLLWHGARGLHGIDDFFKFVEENLYKKLKSVGASNLVFGILIILFGIGAGVMMIINGARLLAHRSDSLF